MRYRVWHRTTYTYDADVTDSLGIAYLTPRTGDLQRVVSRELTVSPATDEVRDDVDVHGNVATFFQVVRPHRELVVRAESVVEVTAPSYDAELLATPWEEARPAARPDSPDAWEAWDGALPTRLAAPGPEVREYVGASLTPGRPLGEVLTDLVRRVHADFAYRPGATTVTTSVAEVMTAHAGVCQDFAHLLLAGLRAHGLAARYVSGYLATTPPPGRERLVGADATHAWIAVWAPGRAAGEGREPGTWLMVDPTNDTWVDERYVTVAWGRDYGDVPPLKGVIYTEATSSSLAVAVDVAPLSEA
ncbi:transglutaminase family protein [Nocardioides sp. ChNu-153]|uniref:transglutaminase family protein n=1 Tax=unclassified Nocardioides TaxID=2615069 RepID=UPI0024060D70|nr:MULTISPECIES: transglutaminase family protein [unclassified Nocardioides]MDF9715174.1 transglutaminase family protein [Nocardioides sp. ChNu-99]MDN7121047.1 transglutaminase family protein [Nocardioides sp. ChNu-153]